MSMSNQSANSLLGFTYAEDEYPQGGQSFSNNYKAGGGYSYRGGKRKGNRGFRPTKQYSVQSAFKFVVKGDKDYMLNLYDPNENVEWKDVVTVIFNMINASDV
jgi:hypothetical protein